MICTEELVVGDRIELHPTTDLWIRGARFGVVVKVGTKWVHVKLDKLASDRPLRFSADHVTFVGKADCSTCGGRYLEHLGYRVHMRTDCKGWN